MKELPAGPVIIEHSYFGRLTSVIEDTKRGNSYQFAFANNTHVLPGGFEVAVPHQQLVELLRAPMLKITTHHNLYPDHHPSKVKRVISVEECPNFFVVEDCIQ